MDKITNKKAIAKPIFIVGRPRSGTKLLRGLLNNHSEISIPFWESNFIPKYIEKAEAFGDLSNYYNFEKFCKFFQKIEFFRKIIQKSEYKELGDIKNWFDAIDDYTYSGALRAFYEMYAQRNHKKIWGDKSPGYMLHIKVLKILFPDSRFIHIIRDVRDHCHSIMNIWNWNPYRAAQQWSNWIKKCRVDARSYLANDYYEIKFENLLENPEFELQQLCNFLSIEYDNSLIILNEPTENLGDAKNERKIMRENKDKWQTKMSDKMIKKIEETSYEMLQEFNYDIFYAKKNKSLTPLEMKIFRVEDALNRFIFDCKSQGGFLKAVKYQYMKRRYG